MEIKLNNSNKFKIIEIDNTHYRDLFLLKSDDINLVISLETFNILKLLKEKGKAKIANLSKEIKELIKHNLVICSDANLDISSSLYIWLHLTDECNLDCKYCYIPSLHSKNKIRDGFFEKLAEVIIRDKSKYNEVNLKLAGGEPFLTLKSWKIGFNFFVKELRQNGIALNIRVITNLTIINDEIINFIKNYKINLSFSIDSLNSKNSRIFYRKNVNSSAKVLENLKILNNRGITPSAMITIDKSNYKNVNDLVEYLIDNNIVFRISDDKGDSNFTNEFEFALNQTIDLLNKAAKNDKDIMYKFLISDLNTLYPKAEPCSMGKTGTAIYMNGDIFFCHTEFGTEKKLGNLWSINSLDETIRSGYHKHLNLNSDCDKCSCRAICAGGCPLYRVNGKSPQCTTYQNIIRNVVELYEKCE